MFEKLLSSLPYNPSLVQQLSFYGRRMKRESSVRRTGVAFLLLAFMVQFFAFISPPQPTLASTSNDIINGGITSAVDAAGKCNADTQSYQKILTYYGISCADVAKAAKVSLSSTAYNKQLFSMGRTSYGATNKATGKPTSETLINVPKVGNLYLRYLWSFDSGASSTYTALQGTGSVSKKTFYLLFNCGNPVFVGLPSHVVLPAATPPTPPPAPSFTVMKGVRLTGSGAFYYKTVTAKPNDSVDFSVSMINNGNSSFATTQIKDSLPTGLSFVPGSLQVDGKASSSTPAVADTGSLIPGQFKRLTFSAKVAAPSTACATYNNVAFATAGSLPAQHDNAGVEVCKPTVVAATPQQPVAPQPVPTPQPAPAPTPAPVPLPMPAAVTTVAATPCSYDLSLSASSPDCKPCDKSVSSADLLACLVRHKSAANETQNLADANNTTAHASDKIVYTLYAENQGKATIKGFVFQENLSDVLDYADVADLNGATRDGDVITWPAVDVKAGQTATVKVAVTVKSPIPTTPQVQGTGRYDHVMTNVYSNAINISIPESPEVQIQTTAAALPNTGPGTSLAIAAFVFITAGYFFARSRLLASESLMAVQDNNSGGF